MKKKTYEDTWQLQNWIDKMGQGKTRKIKKAM